MSHMNFYPPLKKEKPKRERDEKGKFVKKSIPLGEHPDFPNDGPSKKKTYPRGINPFHRRPSRYR